MNLKTFKEMPFKKKLQWLVQYYGIVALVSLIVVFVIGYLIKSILFPEPLPDVCVMILSEDVYTEEAIEMQYELMKANECTFDVRSYIVSDPYAMQSFATRAMTDQLDVIVAPKNHTEDMLNNSYISEYEEIKNTDLCISVPVNARKSKAQENAIDYLRKRFEK